MVDHCEKMMNECMLVNMREVIHLLTTLSEQTQDIKLLVKPLSKCSIFLQVQSAKPSSEMNIMAVSRCILIKTCIIA